MFRTICTERQRSRRDLVKPARLEFLCLLIRGQEPHYHMQDSKFQEHKALNMFTVKVNPKAGKVGGVG